MGDAEPLRISHVTEDPVARYNAGLDRAETLPALRAFLAGWRKLAPDAIATAKAMKPKDWEAWRSGLAMERQRKFAGPEWAERFGAILMPEKMLRTSMTADQFHVPWGLAWIRLTETGQI